MFVMNISTAMFVMNISTAVVVMNISKAMLVMNISTAVFVMNKSTAVFVMKISTALFVQSEDEQWQEKNALLAKERLLETICQSSKTWDEKIEDEKVTNGYVK